MQKVLSAIVAMVMLVTTVFSSVVFADSDLSLDTSIAEDADKRGNFDGDTSITANDAAILLDYVLDKGKRNEGQLKDMSDELIQWLGDVDGDGAVTAADVAQILKKAIGEFTFSGPLTPKPGEEASGSESSSQDESVSQNESTSQDESEPESESEVEIVSGEPAEAIYDGYDVVVDGRIAESIPNRAQQPIFKTVREAVKAAKNGGTEDDPFVIGIVPGLYREQVIVSVPWISMKKINNSTSEAPEVKLTWYYLNEYTYDNVNSDGVWDPDNPKVNEGGNNTPQNWGRSTWVQLGATGFRAEGICFENSGGLYMTKEEKEANVRSVAGKGHYNRMVLTPREGIPEEPVTTKVKTTKEGSTTEVELWDDAHADEWNERSAALFTEADKAVYVNCKVLGTQDSVAAYDGRAYFKNCYLTGRTDFICGHSQSLFDECEIHWESSPYSDSGSVLTASNNGQNQRGYLFVNCKITGGDRTKSLGFARPWGGKNTETIWVNTKVDNSKVTGKTLLGESPWSSMGSEERGDLVQPWEAKFFEYNSMDSSGTPLTIDKSKRNGTSIEWKGIENGILDEWTVLQYNPYQWTAYKGYSTTADWDPLGLKGTYDTIKQKADESLVLNEKYEADFTLPEAPEGYEVAYKIENDNNAKIGSDGRKVTVVRPIRGSGDADVKITAFFKKAGTIEGIEKELSTKIAERADSEGSFKAKGTVKVMNPPAEGMNVTLVFNFASGNHMADKVVNIPAGQNSAEYVQEDLPAAQYKVLVSSDNSEYAVVGGEVKSFTGEVNQDYTLDVTLGKLETVSATASGAPTAIDASKIPTTGVVMESVADPKNEKGTVNHYKNTQASKTTDYGWYWDLADIIDKTAGQSKTDLADTDYIDVEFDLCVPDGSDWGSAVDVIDILGNGEAANLKYEDKADDSRFARFCLGRWNQLNVITCIDPLSGIAKNGRAILNLVGKFKDNEKTNGKNIWCNIKVRIDFKNKTIDFTATGGDNSISEFTEFPDNIDKSKLLMAFYPTAEKSSTDEYYFTNAKVTYQRFVPQEDTSDAVAVTGTSQNIKSIVLVNKEQSAWTHSAVIAADGKISFKEAIPKATYEIQYTLADGSEGIDTISVGGNTVNAEGGKYYINVNAEISDLVVNGKGVAGVDTEQDAVEHILGKSGTKDTTTSVWTLTKALELGSVPGYTITVADNNAVGTNGELKKDGTDETNPVDVTFNVTKQGGTATTVEAKIVKPTKKDGYIVDEDFEDYAVDADTVVPNSTNGKVVYDGTKGRCIAVAATAEDRNKYVLPVTLDDNGVYEISYDFMRKSAEDKNTFDTNYGWKLIFTETDGKETLQYYGKEIKTGNAGKYSNNDPYGTTKAKIKENAVSGEWYNIKYIVDVPNKNIDIFFDGTYYTSIGFPEETTPQKFGVFVYYAGQIVGDTIYLDNVYAKQVNNLESELTAALGANTDNIPDETSEISSETVINLPTSTSGGNKIEWISDDTRIQIDAANKGKVTLTPASTAGTFNLTALVYNKDFETLYNNADNDGVKIPNPAVYKKVFPIKFKGTATDFFTVSGKVNWDIEKPSSATVIVKVMDGENEIASAEAAADGSYSIANVPANDSAETGYTITAEITAGGKENNAVRLIADASGKEITEVNSGKDTTVTANVNIGETEIKTTKIDFTNVKTLPEKLGEDSSAETPKLKSEVITDTDNNECLKVAFASGSESKTADSSVGIGYDLLGLITDSNMKELAKSADTLNVSFDVKVKGYNAGDDFSCINIADGYGTISDFGNGNNKYEKTFVLLNLGTYNQPNIGCASKAFKERIAQMGSGNKGSLKFDDSNNTDKWYNVSFNIDYLNKTVTGTVGVGENVATMSVDGTNMNGSSGIYPCIKEAEFATGYSRDNLNLAYIPRFTNASIYLDNVAISFEGWKTKEETAGYTVSGDLDEGIESVQLQSKGKVATQYDTTITDTGFEVTGVPNGEYNVIIETKSGKTVTTATGLTSDGNGNYSLTVNEDVNDIAISTAEPVEQSLDEVVEPETEEDKISAGEETGVSPASENNADSETAESKEEAFSTENKEEVSPVEDNIEQGEAEVQQEENDMENSDAETV